MISKYIERLEANRAAHRLMQAVQPWLQPDTKEYPEMMRLVRQICERIIHEAIESTQVGAAHEAATILPSLN